MLTIYHTPPTRSVRIVWLAEEMGLPYRVVATPFGPGPKPEGFEKASPLGQLPAILDGEIGMTESIAIMQYMLAKYGPSPLEVIAGERDFPEYLQWLHYGEAGLCSMGNANVATKFRAPEAEQKNWTSSYIGEELARRAARLAPVLEDRAFLVADRFTAADISVAYGLFVLEFFGGALPPACRAYMERMTARPAFLKASAPAS